MIEIMYDMALLEAVKSQNPNNIPYPTPVELLKNKYNIDSLTFANNDKYYASDIKEYQKMNQSVLDRIQEEIDHCNEKFGNWEKVKRFELTPDIWSIDAGHLTPTMKLRRKIIKEKYNDLYQKIYG